MSEKEIENFCANGRISIADIPVTCGELFKIIFRNIAHCNSDSNFISKRLKHFDYLIVTYQEHGVAAMNINVQVYLKKK